MDNLIYPLYGLPDIGGSKISLDNGWLGLLDPNGWTFIYDCLENPDLNVNFQERRKALVRQFRAATHSEERTVNAWQNSAGVARHGKVEPQNQWLRDMSLRFALVPCKIIANEGRETVFASSCLASGYKGALFIPFDHLPYII